MPQSLMIQNPDDARSIARRLTDPFTIAAIAIYALALMGLLSTPSAVLSALLLGFGTALLSGIALAITRGHRPRRLDLVRPQAEVWLTLIWYGVVLLLAAYTSARGIELVNQFTNWLFLVIAPFGLLVLMRRSPLRATFRSIGLTRTGLKDAVRLAAIVGLLSIPVLYVVGDQQRKAIYMLFHEPLRTGVSFVISFVLALLTAGFVEEFFFRGVLQSHLASSMASEWRGLLVASLLFGLFHLPTYYFSPFEPTHSDFTLALTSVITEQAVNVIKLSVR